MSATAIHNEPVSGATRHAVVICDDLDSANGVNAVLERAAIRSDEGVHWTVMPCRLDMLNSAPASDAAMAQAVDAHLIVLALCQAESVPNLLLDWLETWATRRQIQDAALAIFGGGNDHALSAPTAPELRQFAERHGLSLILDNGDLAGDESAFFTRSLRDREMTVTPTLQHILEQPVRSYYQHWGLNE